MIQVTHRAWALAREAAASALSQRTASIVTILVVAGMIVTVMLTTGRTVGTEQNVLSTIDSAGTRSILIRADTDAGVTSDVLGRIAGVEGIEWAGAFSSAVDATNSLVPDGIRVPVRYAYGSHLDRLGIPSKQPVAEGLAYASAAALDQLGLVDGAGGITLTTGASYGVAGRIKTPDFLAGFEPVVLVPERAATVSEPVNVLVVIATSPDLVSPVADAVVSVLAPDDPTKVTVKTSEALAQLRGLVQDQLGSFSRGLVLIVLAITGLLVAVILYGLVMMRRKDFGRRRALGATRALVVGLLLTQTLILAIIGVAAGSVIAITALVAADDPLPGMTFFVATGVLAVTTAVIAALIPAIVASRREPIKELRVP